VGEARRKELSIKTHIVRRITLKWILESYDGSGMNFIDLVQDRYQWRAVLNTMMNLQDP
jgi:hypothetical protein